jgi:hypothetical protein
MIEKSDVFSIDGVLKAVVKQKAKQEWVLLY